MSITFEYSRIAPDYGDIDNETGRLPGHHVEIGENDGLVVLQTYPANQDATAENLRGVAYNADEAGELVAALQEAIKRVRQKTQRSGNSHPPRVRD